MLLEIKNLTKKYGKKVVLNKIELKINEAHVKRKDLLELKNKLGFKNVSFHYVKYSILKQQKLYK